MQQNWCFSPFFGFWTILCAFSDFSSVFHLFTELVSSYIFLVEFYFLHYSRQRNVNNFKNISWKMILVNIYENYVFHHHQPFRPRDEYKNRLRKRSNRDNNKKENKKKWCNHSITGYLWLNTKNDHLNKVMTEINKLDGKSEEKGKRTKIKLKSWTKIRKTFPYILTRINSVPCTQHTYKLEP